MDPMSTRELEEKPLAPQRIAGRKSPGLAATLSLLPGLGQVYLGHYMRGFTHVIVIGTSITIATLASGAEPLLGLFIAFFWLFGMIDAARLATSWNDALAHYGIERLPQPVLLPTRGSAIAAGVLLIGAGFLSLLNVRFGVSMSWMREWWPLAPVGFGIWLLVRGLQDRRSSERQQPEGRTLE